MQHPFDGIVKANEESISRRAALGVIAGTVAVGAAQALVPPPRVTTQAVGEEGGPRFTTQALGEEGGRNNLPVTTEPFGEEAGRVTSKPTPGLEDGKKTTTLALKETGGGGPTTKALGEEGGPKVTTRAIGEEGGRPLTRARFETGGKSVSVKAGSKKLTTKQLDSLWNSLGSTSAAAGTQASAQLYGAKGAVEFLQKRLKEENLKLTRINKKHVAAHIENLNSDDSGVRNAAQTSLINLGRGIEPMLQEALKNSKSREQQRRLRIVLARTKETTQLRQARRGLQVLVALNNAESKNLLTTLAKGKEGEWFAGMATLALSQNKPRIKRRR